MKAAIKLLHVDDDADIREVTTLALGLDPNIKVRSVASGLEAIEVLAGGWQPDLMLLDVMMPDLDGPATLARLRELEGCEHLPVVFMTARAQPHEHARFQDLGVIGVVVKPFDPMTLAERLRDLLAASA